MVSNHHHIRQNLVIPITLNLLNGLFTCTKSMIGLFFWMDLNQVINCQIIISKSIHILLFIVTKLSAHQMGYFIV